MPIVLGRSLTSSWHNPVAIYILIYSLLVTFRRNRFFQTTVTSVQSGDDTNLDSDSYLLVTSSSNCASLCVTGDPAGDKPCLAISCPRCCLITLCLRP